MKSKVLALTLLTAFVSVICAPAAFAQSAADYPSLLPDGAVEIQVNATGTLGATTELTVDYGSGLNFSPDTGEYVATADQVVTVNFTDNNPGFQVIIVSTENPTVLDPVTNATIVRSGLITPAEETASVPIHWTVFDTQAEAAAYNFETSVFPDGFIQEGTDVSGKIDNRVNFYVVDRNQSDFYTADVLGFAAVISGVTNELGSLASAPYDATPTVDDDTDPTTPEQNDGAQRSTIDGEVFMKFGADYNGAPAGTYATTTLTLDLITI